MKNVISVDELLIDLLFGKEGLVNTDGSSVMGMIRHAQDKKLVRVKQALHSLLISKLPEKKELILDKEYSTPRELLTHEQDIKLNTNHQILGFNKAVDDMRKSIDELFEVKK